MEQAIDILEDWIQKQDHFVKKDFHRGYLERVIISTKGSIERAKTRVDKLCTMRAMWPHLFEKCHVKADFPKLHETYINLHMPTLTEDNNRIYVAKLTAKSLTPDIFLEAYQHSVILSEYMKLHDYSHGCHVIGDFRDVNIMEMLSHINLMEFRNVITLYLEGYGFGVKGIYVLSTSKLIYTFINMVKPLISAKIADRIRVLKDVESLQDYLPKRLLPEDYGGSQKSLLTLYDEWVEELSTEKHVAYTKDMRLARTNEVFRRKDKCQDEYLGMSGTFKILSID
ncbi:alpha-tocopherol transfer protein-like [Cydia fagiglandana]|uniref:alpha-tocopherol transfer protein-like n=1 Tax=Cydia fagiglandana TaxID=1458189 RepID=UPI002FEDF3E8